MTVYKPREWLPLAVPPVQPTDAKPQISQPRMTCPRCDPTARAMDYVRNLWIAAGIDRD